MSSSNFTCIASESRFCVLWIRNTIKKVTIVVPVLMMSCHVSLKPNSGPVIAQIMITATARMKVPGRPVARAVHLANRENHDCDLVGLIFPFNHQMITHALRFGLRPLPGFLLGGKSMSTTIFTHDHA